eukprot:CAMPEP_0179846356 /NCGR_PEP_ID=MMETSP0982-20121206/5511_1 /TAXON_ID=483367 /ORGANISM="non described non described, Strain CCMP 2436" /LENGTH=137 /DNA_ID=CAMNT_0021731479 /DNA_START=240 /DNA_END=650 /DNA_ORIENTATION=-
MKARCAGSFPLTISTKSASESVSVQSALAAVPSRTSPALPSTTQLAVASLGPLVITNWKTAGAFLQISGSLSSSPICAKRGALANPVASSFAAGFDPGFEAGSFVSLELMAANFCATPMLPTILSLPIMKARCAGSF